MRLAFVVNEVAGGWKPTDVRLGGTEESVVRWAEELQRFGHEVSVFQNGYYGFHSQVWYDHREDYAGDFDATINVKSPDVAPLGPTLYYTNETDAGRHDLSGYDAVVWPSQWAADNIQVNNDKIRVLGHGYDPKAIYPDRKVPKQVLYASSPDRGLNDLLAVWPYVYEAHPDTKLAVTYGTQAEGDMPGVEFLGDVNEAKMDELYRTSDVWCHPCTGVELFCITGLKAQAAGCVPVYYPAMALIETVKEGIMTNKEMLVSDLIDALGSESLKSEVRQRLSTYNWPTWETTALELLTLINGIIRP